MKILLSFLALIPATTSASIGRTFSSGLENTCKVEIFQDDLPLPTVCSGSLISPKKLKTAAHCVNKHLKNFSSIEVTCPGNQKTQLSSPPLIHPLFSDSDSFKSGDRQYDTAILPLNDPQKLLNQAAIPESSTFLKAILNSASFCFVAGYGLNEHHPNEMGHYKESLASPSGLRLRKNTLANFEFYNFSVLPGDSGGSLFCLDAQGVLYDMATISGRTPDGTSLFSPSYKVYDFIDLEKQPSHFFSIEKPTSQEISFKENHSYLIKPFSKIFIEGKVQYTVDTKIIFTLEKIENGKAFGKFTMRSYSQFYICLPEILCQNSGEALVELKNLTQP